jgi:H+-transporting ATPase
MVTGDALAIARETAKTLGMGTNILDASTLGDEKQQGTAAVTKAIEAADGFAQVFPEHKFHIVDDLQKSGYIVGMTGDGVNDAPALKKADCGIAVSGATDAARASAAIVLMTPGLSVIIDAIKESRKIFQRMNSYAMYRIAETLRVLLFMTLAILIFNFYPVTAVMIVMLALLNDGAILSIAYDNVHYKDQPEAWNMRLVLGVATTLGLVGPIAAFGLFFLGDRVFHLNHPHLQSMMYLMLSVAGHLTIFQTRTRGPWWSIRPARILWMAVFGTQICATLIAVYGVLMTPLGWGWALFVWGYAVVWFLVTDPVKLLAYRIFNPVKAAPHREVIAEPKPDAKAVPKPKAKVEAPPDAKAAPQPEAKAEPKPEAQAEPKPEAKGEPKPEAKAESKPDAEPVPPTPASAATLLNTSLGELLVAGLVKDPEDAGRIIAAAIKQAGVSIAAAKAPDAKVAPLPEAKAKTPSEVTPEPAK